MSMLEARAVYAVSQRMLEERGFEVAMVLDVGAAEAAYFLQRVELGLFPKAGHFFVDAMEENVPLYRSLGERFGTGHEIAALSCAEGEVELRIDPTFYNTHIEGLQPATEYAATRRVPLRTLDGVVGRHGLKGPFLLKLDVQGAELDVLRGALRTLEDAVIVTTEIQIFPERDGLAELLLFMQGQGWALYDLTNLGHYPSDGSLCQCYATFIPRAMDFRRGVPWCLPEQRDAILGQLEARRARNIAGIGKLLGKD